MSEQIVGRKTRRHRACMVPVCVWLCLGAVSLALAQGPRIQPEDLEYVGAFQPPPNTWGALDQTPRQYGFGLLAMAYRPSDTPRGSNGGSPGSLLATNHVYDKGYVGEFTIPQAAISHDINALPYAQSLRSPAYLVSDKCSGAPYKTSPAGLAYVAEQNLILWTCLDWYNATPENLDGLGWSTGDFTNPLGPWHLGSRSNVVFHYNKWANYLFLADPDFARQYLNGYAVIAGYYREAGAFNGSFGPTLYAFSPTVNASSGEIPAMPLLYYREANPYPDYRTADKWAGGAWINTGTKQAVVLFVSKGRGPDYYGEPHPGHCGYKGYHSEPYEAQIVFYNPADLAQVVAGKRDPWSVVPYATKILGPQPTGPLFPDCRNGTFGGVAYDRARGLIYAAQQLGEQSVIHVWRVAQSPASTDTPPPAAPTGLQAQ